MMTSIDQLLSNSSRLSPNSDAVCIRDEVISYSDLDIEVSRVAALLGGLSQAKGGRVAVYLEKRFEAVISLLGISRSGKVFVPINPVLKGAQVRHILNDCEVEILITSVARLKAISSEIEDITSLQKIILIDDKKGLYIGDVGYISFYEEPTVKVSSVSIIDRDNAAILYTSGSTGKPKGVVLSHRNIIAGAQSVAEYLNNSSEDRLLAVLPFSFDYGLSQLTTMLLVGGTTVLINYLFPLDVIKAVEKFHITGLAAVPPLWTQLADLQWPEGVSNHLRYITNSGGAMPESVLKKLRASLPETDPILMYGLTEAFRSTYLPFSELDKRPTSIGKAIPNAEVMVLRQDGSECDIDEPGELVHRGALVAKGYWNDTDKTAERFRLLNYEKDNCCDNETVVWSGDIVKKDEDGFLYFIGRNDEMIKTSGYRVSPAEIEDYIFSIEGVDECVSIGVPHNRLGQAIILLIKASDEKITEKFIIKECRRVLPLFMVPAVVEIKDVLPRNANGKIDRSSITKQYREYFSE